MKNMMMVAALVLSSFSGSMALAKSTKKISCRPQGLNWSADVLIPEQIGDLPEIDFDYPAQVTTFSFRDKNLLLVAMDQEDPTRLRMFVSAQKVKGRPGVYRGQSMTDLGNNEIQIDNGPVICYVQLVR